MSIRSLVSKATSNDETPTNGFQLNELAQRSRLSLQDCRSLEDLLVKRLKNDSPNVKLKVLRVIKYLCMNGRQDFRIDFQRKNEPLKECLAFKGSPDVLRGLAPYKQVQEAAKEAMNSIFEGAYINNAPKNRIQGFGRDQDGVSSSIGQLPSSSMSAAQCRANTHSFDTDSSPRGSGSGSQMVGFGNNNYVPKRKSKTETGFIGKVRSRLSWSQKSTEPSSSPRRPSYTGPSIPSYPSPNNRPFESNQNRRSGSVGGNWDEAGTTVTVNRGSNRSKSPSGNQNFERRLVDQITAPSGIKPTPAHAQLSKFVESANGLDGALISSLLEEQLHNVEWKAQIKALYVIEALLKHDNPEVVDFFLQNDDGIQELEGSMVKTVRGKAIEILDFLDGISTARGNPSSLQDSPSDSECSTQQQRQQPATTQDYHSSPKHHQSQVQSSKQPTMDILDFSEMNDQQQQPLPSSIQREPMDNQSDLLAFMDTNSVGQSAAAVTGTSGGFDFINNNTTTTSSDPISHTTGLFGNLQVKATEPVPVEDNNLFGNLNVKGKVEPDDPLRFVHGQDFQIQQQSSAPTQSTAFYPSQTPQLISSCNQNSFYSSQPLGSTNNNSLPIIPTQQQQCNNMQEQQRFNLFDSVIPKSDPRMQPPVSSVPSRIHKPNTSESSIGPAFDFMSEESTNKMKQNTEYDQDSCWGSQLVDLTNLSETPLQRAAAIKAQNDKTLRAQGGTLNNMKRTVSPNNSSALNSPFPYNTHPVQMPPSNNMMMHSGVNNPVYRTMSNTTVPGGWPVTAAPSMGMATAACIPQYPQTGMAMYPQQVVMMQPNQRQSTMRG